MAIILAMNYQISKEMQITHGTIFPYVHVHFLSLTLHSLQLNFALLLSNLQRYKHTSIDYRNRFVTQYITHLIITILLYHYIINTSIVLPICKIQINILKKCLFMK
jgi:hypothetical protein